MYFFNSMKKICVLGSLISIIGCAGQSETSGVGQPSKTSSGNEQLMPTVISVKGQYAGTVTSMASRKPIPTDPSPTTPPPEEVPPTPLISGFEGTIVSCANSASTNQPIISTNITSNGVTTSSGKISSSIALVPNDTCTINITKITLASGDYTFSSPIVVTGTASQNPNYSDSKQSDAAVLLTQQPSFIYASASFKLFWSGSGGFQPELSIIYGADQATVNAAASSSFTTVDLTGTSTNGLLVQAPTYCVGSGTTCDARSFTNTKSFQIGHDVYYNPIFESLNLIQNGAGTQQTGETYKIFSLNTDAQTSVPLVKDGVLAPVLSGITPKPTPPANSNCGYIKNISSVTGCTYAVVDALFNSTPTTGLVLNASGTNFGSNLALTTTPNKLPMEGDFLGWGFGKLNPTILANTAQGAIKYLIIQHKHGANADSSCTPNATASCVPSYQLFILNAGYTPAP